MGSQWQLHWSNVGLPGFELPVGGPGGDERDFLAIVRTPTTEKEHLQPRVHQRLTLAALTVLSKILIAWVLVAVTVAVHAVGLALLLRSLMRSHALPPTRFWPITWLLIRVTWWLILIHLAEIAIWGMFYFWQACLPDAESAFYFAGVTYTTVGYGDLVLPKPWRMLGPVEGLTGILMCGLSTGFFFAVVSKVFGARSEAEPN